MKLTLRICNSIHLLLQLPHLSGTVFIFPGQYSRLSHQPIAISAKRALGHSGLHPVPKTPS